MKISVAIEADVNVKDKNVAEAILILQDVENGEYKMTKKEFSYYAEIVKNYLINHTPYSFMDDHPKKAGNIIAVYKDDVPIMEW